MSEYMINDKTWYYFKNNQKEGPFTENEIIKLIQHQIIEGDDYIWMLDLNDWVLLKNSLFSIYMTNNDM
ncbi:MAG: DUF4339 domain-containing protein [Erysipelotrichaceae bacterium]|jgi:hypothetical protein|nr:DUF4339 domain-containing protein [Bacillota bacterium]NLP21775.1 DUF4339 domain-containing protein [Erysipelotrichaceae bacterium]HCY06215.1 DUF4339 domain-containing protein [Erysipelotrichaceae bacterium]